MTNRTKNTKARWGLKETKSDIFSQFLVHCGCGQVGFDLGLKGILISKELNVVR